MGGCFGEVFAGLVSVKDGAAKGGDLQAVSVALACDVPSGKNKSKFSFARLTKEDNRAVSQTFLIGVPCDLLKDRLLIFLAVKAEKNLLDQILLVGSEVFANAGFGNMPVVFDLRSFLMIERQADFGMLRLVQAFVNRSH